MTRSIDQFRAYLHETHPSSPAMHSLATAATSAHIKGLRDLWQASDLSAGEFAEEVAAFWDYPRLKLPDMLALERAQDGFSARFLRDSMLCAMRRDDGTIVVAIADPTHTAALRAAEIVFGTGFETVVASFEDVAIVLDEHRDAGRPDSDGGMTVAQSEDDIESLRDLASGAPVVRAFNDLLEQALEYRASDIHIEPFRTG